MKKTLFVIVLLLMCSQLFASKFHKGDIVIPIRGEWIGVACILDKVITIREGDPIGSEGEDRKILYYIYVLERIEDIRWRYRSVELDGVFNKNFEAKELILYKEFIK